MGNRLTRTDSAAGTINYFYNAANMLTGSTGANASAYTNDADGNTLTGGNRTMAWDSQNRMTSCALNGPTSTFTSGADGLRRSMTNPMGVTTDYVYDLGHLSDASTGLIYMKARYHGPRGREVRRRGPSQRRQELVCLLR